MGVCYSKKKKPFVYQTAIICQTWPRGLHQTDDSRDSSHWCGPSQTSSLLPHGRLLWPRAQDCGRLVQTQLSSCRIEVLSYTHTNKHWLHTDNEKLDFQKQCKSLIIPYTHTHTHTHTYISEKTKVQERRRTFPKLCMKLVQDKAVHIRRFILPCMTAIHLWKIIGRQKTLGVPRRIWGTYCKFWRSASASKGKFQLEQLLKQSPGTAQRGACTLLIIQMRERTQISSQRPPPLGTCEEGTQCCLLALLYNLSVRQDVQVAP